MASDHCLHDLLQITVAIGRCLSTLEIGLIARQRRRADGWCIRRRAIHRVDRSLAIFCKELCVLAQFYSFDIIFDSTLRPSAEAFESNADVDAKVEKERGVGTRRDFFFVPINDRSLRRKTDDRNPRRRLV